MAQTHNINSVDRRSKVRSLRSKNGSKCSYCKKRMLFHVSFCNDPKYATLDHIIPTSHRVWETVECSPNIIANLVLACTRCNCHIVRTWSVDKKLKVLGRTFESCLEAKGRNHAPHY